MRMAALRMQCGVHGERRTVKKTIKNLVIPMLNQAAVIHGQNIKVHSVFFDVMDEALHMYTILQGQTQLHIRARYERGYIVATCDKDQTISLSCRQWIDAALMQTVKEGITYHKPKEKKEEEKEKPGPKYGPYDTRWIKTTSALVSAGSIHDYIPAKARIRRKHAQACECDLQASKAAYEANRETQDEKEAREMADMERSWQALQTLIKIRRKNPTYEKTYQEIQKKRKAKKI